MIIIKNFVIKWVGDKAMADLLNLSEKNILWLDIGLYFLLAVIFILVLITHNVFLQFLTATLLIVIGTLELFSGHLMPFLLEWRDSLIEQYGKEEEIKIVLNGFLSNKLLLKIIFYFLVFFVVLLGDVLLYFLLIKRKFHPSFSLRKWKSNLWKVIYLPLIFIALAYLLAPFSLLIKNIEKKSYFQKVVQATKLKRLIKRTNKYNFFLSLFVAIFQNEDEVEKVKEIVEDNLEAIDQKNEEEKREIFVKIMREIKKDATKSYQSIKENEILKEIDFDKILDSDDPLVEEKAEIDKFFDKLKEEYQNWKNNLNILKTEDQKKIEDFIDFN